MREWLANHPRAKLLARNRRLIIDAAREMFLRHGYAATGMEAVAAAAGVSIMTLYRHAKSKDELFAAVVTATCQPDDEEHQAQLRDALTRPLGDVLTFVGCMFQMRLVDPQTIALFRMVMVEADHFLRFGPLAYQGFITVHVDMLCTFLASHPDTRDLPSEVRQELATEFMGNMVGLPFIGAMLRAAAPTVAEQEQRSARATASLLEALQRGRERS